ncbi:uncharacterized protein B0H64DRAFT_407764 [Chaetomium fimeti]|uniref:Uncharacterized protein n=1 Tax=Chaetomium fimeti TaxID=1854472 RepID=A0AAE0H821_9PEZI|nr:hypothetical protein B0H64DRAFT_407764 [Chaetomium fimeti]
MPAVIRPDPLIRGSGKNRDRGASSPFGLLLPSRGRRSSSISLKTRILRSSFSFPDNAPEAGVSVVPNKNGFVHTVIRAWQQDLHLRLRPDDIWLAILAQFSLFVNGNAEALRPIFVAHEGRPELVVDARPATVETVNLGVVAQQLAKQVKQNLKDPAIATTLLPSFTTTTPHDRATAAMVFLGAMKEYFSYGVRFGCSFPSVTLLGERSDWADMLKRVTWFGTIDHEETIEWTLRLTKVLEYMVASFDRPEDTDVKSFWTHAVHETGADTSGNILTLSGWLTAFCWWGADGQRIKSFSDEELSRYQLEGEPDGYRRLRLNGVEFPVIQRKKVPASVVKVPLTLYQDGLEPRKASLLAGSMGMQVIGEDDETSVQPVSGWWLLSAS